MKNPGHWFHGRGYGRNPGVFSREAAPGLRDCSPSLGGWERGERFTVI
jgi:hypothetical protein